MNKPTANSVAPLGSAGPALVRQSHANVAAHSAHQRSARQTNRNGFRQRIPMSPANMSPRNNHSKRYLFRFLLPRQYRKIGTGDEMTLSTAQNKKKTVIPSPFTDPDAEASATTTDNAVDNANESTESCQRKIFQCS